jgi:hypothetical protein
MFRLPVGRGCSVQYWTLFRKTSQMSAVKFWPLRTGLIPFGDWGMPGEGPGCPSLLSGPSTPGKEKPRVRRGQSTGNKVLEGRISPRFDRQKSSSVFLPSSIETGVAGAGSVTEPVTSGSSSAG